jgi:predicted Zn-dependent protease
MEIFRFNILPLEEIEKREAFKEAVNNCPHCGSVMQFSVEIDFLTNRLQEDSFCQSCTVKVRSEIHSLQ